jgi:hypothetical protein
MPTKTKLPSGAAASKLIDGRIREYPDWRGDMLARLRSIVHKADPKVVEEWKWDVPIWSHEGIVCTGEVYKAVVKMTFARGASVKDPAKLFNSSMGGGTRRAIDFRAGETLNEKALVALIKEAVKVNQRA